MARIKGVTTFAANFESEKSAPLIDMYCETVADMIDPVQQQAHDGASYMYYGRKAIVFNDPNSENNGTYQLIDAANPTILTSWAKMEGLSITSVTYAELTALISTNSLKQGQFYRITDYQTKHGIPYSDDGTGAAVVNTGVVEDLIVQAITDNQISKEAISPAYPDDKILYDIDDTEIGGENVNGYFEDGVDGGDPITFSNITSNTFEINRSLVINDDFYLYCEDDTGAWSEYDSSDYNVRFTVTDLGGGQYRYTLDNIVDLADPNYNNAEMEGQLLLDDRKGFIIYREDIIRRINKGYDFRNAKFRRYKPDATAMAYSNAKNYGLGDFCMNGGNLYKSVQANNLNHSTGDTDWWRMTYSGFGAHYVLYRDGISMGGNELLRADLNDFVDLYTFCKLDTATGTATFHDTATDMREIMGDYTYGEVDNNVMVELDNNSMFIEKVSFGNDAQSNTWINGFFTNMRIKDDFKYNIINHESSTSQCDIADSMRSNFITGQFQLSTLGFNVSNNVVRYLIESTIGNNISYNYLYGIYKSHLGSSVSNNMFMQNIQYTTFGDFISGNYITGSMQYNVIRNHFKDNRLTGPTFQWNYIPDNCERNLFGSNTRWNTNLGTRFQDNTILGNLQWLDISDAFRNNTIISGGYMYRTTIDYLFNGNSIYRMDGCTISDHFENNMWSSGTFRANIVNTDIRNYNFSSATHAMEDYTCHMYKRPDNTDRLRYFDNTDTEQITNVDA